MLRRAGKVLGVVGAVAAVLWAMRDRFVSLRVPREPEPPKFRVAPPLPADPVVLGPADDLTAIVGIGPVYAARLRAGGFPSFSSLASAPPDQVAGAARVPASRVLGWIEQARRLLIADNQSS